MNQRERILAIAVGAVAVIIVGYFGISWLGGMFKVRQEKVAGLEKEIEDQKRFLARGVVTAKRLKELETRALPPQVGQASSLYREFLLDTADQKAGLRDVNVRATPGGAKKGVYQRLSFAMTADGNLEQLTKFLYLFHSVDYLHRIQTLRVTPLKESKDLKLVITIEALSLPGALKRDKLASGPANRLALATEEEYKKVILDRNLFGPPNRPPQMSALGSQRAETKKPFSLAFKITDPDALDKFKVELDAGQTKGASLKVADPAKPGEPASATFSFTPPAKGEYTFTVRAFDDGLPVREDKKTFKVTVSDPPPRVEVGRRPDPPPRPTFDVAKFTFLTSIVERDGEPGIWLIERTTGKRHELREGDKFEIGKMKGVVAYIGRQEIEIEVDGKRLVLSLGSNLSEAFEL